MEKLKKSLAIENKNENSDVTVMSKSGEEYSVPKEHAHQVTDEILVNFERSLEEIKEGKANEPMPKEWIEE